MSPHLPPEDGTPDYFHALLNALDARDPDRAAELYEALRRKLIRFFEWRGCEFPEDLVDETFDRVGRRLHEGIDAKDPAKYVYGVARLVYQEVWRESLRKERALKSGEWPPAPPPDDPEDNPLLEALRRCLAKMEDEQRRLVLKYYQSDRHIQDRKQLSDDLGIPINALRIRVHRLRRRLEECLEMRPRG